MPTLADTGNVYVTLAAARTYARHEGCEVETARRELTAHLMGARQKRSAPGQPEQWRWRNGSVGLDITARVVRDGPLALVVSVSVREDTRR